MVRRVMLAIAMVVLAAAGISCGGNMDPACVAAINVTPPNAAADHLLGGASSQQTFSAFAVPAPGCSVQQSALKSVTWSVSDTSAATISNASDATFGTAICRNSTPNPVTVTAMMAAGGQIISGTATLDCR
jgi:hypothetical protein